MYYVIVSMNSRKRVLTTIRRVTISTASRLVIASETLAPSHPTPVFLGFEDHLFQRTPAFTKAYATLDKKGKRGKRGKLYSWSGWC